MLIDSHVHVGQFYNLYFAPSDISLLMRQANVDYYAVSSTTICEENYIKVVDEFHELIDIDGKKVLPVMWVTPESLKGIIAWFLESDINWKCLKIHPFLHRNDWEPDGSQFSEILDIAREMSLPLLIHTDNHESCMALKYGNIIANNPDIQFILAHRRPLNQIMSLFNNYSNVYADSAFMSIRDMQTIIEKGHVSRLLWGTDMCIPSYYNPKLDLVLYYKDKLSALRNICNENIFFLITYQNSYKVFKVKENRIWKS